MSSLSLHQNATQQIFEHAKWLRNNVTLTESILWEEVRNKKLGVKFRRQHPLGAYVVDFYCHELRLVIELDGEYHTSVHQQGVDQEKDLELLGSGSTVLRINDKEVLEKLPGVIELLKLTVSDLKKNII
ncbi:MAG: endonuclease domain-containing protein [Saprospiraceae bacterium]|nr:endonuclease domain-containing protein [Saprospiraceae bacterium]